MTTAQVTATPDLPRAVIYLRISDDKAGREAGVTRQRDACIAEAARHGWHVVDVVTDNDRSASEYATTVRTGYARVRDMVEAGSVDVVLAWSGDRLHRRMDELEAWIKGTRGRAVTHLVNGGALDLTSAAGKMQARQSGTFAAYETDVRSERVRAAMAQMAKDGRWRGGPAFGWISEDVEASPGRVVQRFTGRRDPAEAAAIVKASADVLAGKSLSGVATEWTALGLTTHRGARWGTTNVRQVLLRAANAALVIHRGEVVGPGQWDAIVTEDVWRSVTAKLTDPSRRRSTSTVAKWLGPSVYRCGICDGPLRSSSGNGTTLYRCRNASHVYRQAAPLDELVGRHVVAVLSMLSPVGASPADDVDAADDPRAEIDKLRRKLEDVALDFADDRVTREQRDVMTERLRRRIAAVEVDLTPDPAREVVAAMSGPLARKHWDAAPLHTRRMIVRRLIEVRVHPVGRGSRAAITEGVSITPRPW